MDEIIQETRLWPPGQVNDLINALTSGSPANQNHEIHPNAAAEAKFREFAKKIDAIWVDSNIDYSNQEIVALIRKSRGDRA